MARKSVRLHRHYEKTKGKHKMKYVYPIPPQVTLVDTFNEPILEPVRDEDGNVEGEEVGGRRRAKRKPIVFTASRFVRTRLNDLKFGKNMETILAAYEIKAMLDEAEKNGTSYWAFEDAHHRLLLEVLNDPTPVTVVVGGGDPRDSKNTAQVAYLPGEAHNYVPFMRAIRDATSKKSERPEVQSATESLS